MATENTAQKSKFDSRADRRGRALGDNTAQKSRAGLSLRKNAKKPPSGQPESRKFSPLPAKGSKTGSHRGGSGSHRGRLALAQSITRGRRRKKTAIDKAGKKIGRYGGALAGSFALPVIGSALGGLVGGMVGGSKTARTILIAGLLIGGLAQILLLIVIILIVVLVPAWVLSGFF